MIKGETKLFFESVGSLCTTAPSSSETIGEGFELTNGKITVNMKEIQGKSIWVRVGARVRIIGSSA